MKKYSKNQGFIEFSNKFLTNEDCLEYFKKIRWKRGFVCPYCGKKPCWTIAPNKYKYKCRNCGRQTSVTAGTFFHRTHLTMLQWFRAINYCCEEGDNATAKELKSKPDIGIGSYRIAQSTLEKIKLRMYHNDKDKLGWTNDLLDGDVNIWAEEIPINNTPIEIIIAVEYIPVEDGGAELGRIRILENENKLRTKELIGFLRSKYTTPDSNIKFNLYTTKDILDLFIEWCKGKKTKNFTVLSRRFCRIFNHCNTPVSFDTVLENMVKP